MLSSLLKCVLAVVVAAAVLPAAASAQSSAPNRPRNVLLIISDDQGRDLGAYGGAVRTPNLDRLAARGTLFTQAFATVSSCSPSRSVLYSGLYSHSNGMYGLAHDVHNQHFMPGVKTLPVMLKEAGYATALVGKKHILPDDALPFDAELAPERSGYRDVAFMADQAESFIRANPDKPFLVIVGYSDPHRAPENFGNTQQWPRTEREIYDPSKLEPPPHLPDLPEVRQDLAHYYESVSRLDSGIGLLLDAVKSAGRDRDTLVIYLSDNGGPFPGAKTTLYDAGIHLPLIIASPDQRARGVRNQAMVSWIDIVPTILDWTGVPAPKNQPLQGRSILPILEQTNAPGWDKVYASHAFHEIQQYYPMRAIRTPQYKYIANLAHQLAFPIAGDVESSPSWQAIRATPGATVGGRSVAAYLHRPAEELYDVAKDPHELNNLAADPAYRPVLEQMRRDLVTFQTRTRDPWRPGGLSPYDHVAH